MAEQSGFFNANSTETGEYDRVYLAQSFASYFASFVGNGVFAEHANKLQVVETEISSMAVKVTSGQAWINGYWYNNTDDFKLSIDVADGVLSRIDSIVVRYGAAERSINLTVIKGTPSSQPKAPDILRTGEYFDLQLATISVPAGTSAITQVEITDTRADASACGWVKGIIDQIDATNLFAQFQASFDQWYDRSQSAFDQWFEHVKDQLSEDAAGKIQVEIDEMNEVLVDIPDDEFISYITGKA